jgi:hypothetical protein
MALYLPQISTGLKLAGRHHHLHYFMANLVATGSVGNYLFVGFKLQENFHLVFFLSIAVKKDCSECQIVMLMTKRLHLNSKVCY